MSLLLFESKCQYTRVKPGARTQTDSLHMARFVYVPAVFVPWDLGNTCCYITTVPPPKQRSGGAEDEREDWGAQITQSSSRWRSEEKKKKFRSTIVRWRERKKKGQRAPTVTVLLCVGCTEMYKRCGCWVVAMSSPVCNKHAPLPLFTLDELQSSSTPISLGVCTVYEAHTSPVAPRKTHI